MSYPIDLTASDWVDHLETLKSRDEKIIALATFMRRADNAARADVLTNLSAPDPEEHAVVQVHAQKAFGNLKPLPDYTEEPKPIDESQPKP